MRIKGFSVSRAAMLSCVSALAIAGAGNVYAEEADAAAAGDGLEVIVVTAQRVDQRLQSVPVAVTAFSAVALEQHSIANISDLQHHVPSLSIVEQAESGGITIGMRGINVSAPTFSFDPAVGVYVNSVFSARSNDLNSTFFDVGNVQVLRGPQGTLFGRDTPVGAVLVDTARPGSAFGGYFDVGVGAGGGDIGNGSERQFYRVEGAVDLPATDDLNLRVAGYHVEDDGFAESTFSGYRNYSKDDTGIRATAVYTPTDNFSATAILDFNHKDDGQPMLVPIGSTVPITAVAYDQLNGGTVGIDALNAMLANPNPFATQSGMTGQGLRGDNASATLLLNYQLSDNWSLRSITGWRHSQNVSTVDNVPVPVFVGPTIVSTHQNQFSQEFVLDGDLTENVHVLGGLYYFNETGYETDFIGGAVTEIDIPAFSLPSPPFPVLPPFGPYTFFINPPLQFSGSDIENSSAAAFVNLAYEIVPDLTISGGVRYSFEKKTLRARGEILPFVTGLPTFFPVNLLGLPASVPHTTLFDDTTESTTHVPVYNTKLTWQATDDLLLYASYGTGFRSGGVGFRAANSEFEAETSQTYEVGAKWEFHIGSMPARLNTALFDTTYKNFQVSVVQIIGGQVSQVVVNAGAATIRGAEAEFTINPTDGLQLSASLALLDASYDEFIYPATNTAPATDLKNNDLRSAPEMTVGVSARYTIPTGIGDLVSVLDYAYSSSYEADSVYQTHAAAPYTTSQFHQGPTNNVNARITLSEAFGSNWDVSVWGKNLTDEIRITDGLNIGGLNAAAYAEPRSVGIQLRSNF